MCRWKLALVATVRKRSTARANEKAEGSEKMAQAAGWICPHPRPRTAYSYDSGQPASVPCCYTVIIAHCRAKTASYRLGVLTERHPGSQYEASRRCRIGSQFQLHTETEAAESHRSAISRAGRLYYGACLGDALALRLICLICRVRHIALLGPNTTVATFRSLHMRENFKEGSQHGTRNTEHGIHSRTEYSAVVLFPRFPASSSASYKERYEQFFANQEATRHRCTRHFIMDSAPRVL